MLSSGSASARCWNGAHVRRWFAQAKGLVSVVITTAWVVGFWMPWLWDRSAHLVRRAGYSGAPLLHQPSSAVAALRFKLQPAHRCQPVRRDAARCMVCHSLAARCARAPARAVTQGAGRISCPKQALAACAAVKSTDPIPPHYVRRRGEDHHRVLPAGQCQGPGPGPALGWAQRPLPVRPAQRSGRTLWPAPAAAGRGARGGSGSRVQGVGGQGCCTPSPAPAAQRPALRCGAPGKAPCSAQVHADEG